MITFTDTARTKVAEFIAGADCAGLRIRAFRVGRYTFCHQIYLLNKGASGHRELLGKVKDLAGRLRKSLDGMSQTRARAARRQTQDPALRRELTRLDRAMAGARARRPG